MGMLVHVVVVVLLSSIIVGSMGRRSVGASGVDRRVVPVCFVVFGRESRGMVGSVVVACGGVALEYLASDHSEEK